MNWDNKDEAWIKIKRDPFEIRNCSSRLRDDDDLARYAVEEEYLTFKHCSDRLRDDFDFSFLAVKKYPRNFRHCSDRLKDDGVLARFVVENDVNCFSFCSDRLRDDDALAALAVEKPFIKESCWSLPCNNEYRKNDNFKYCSDRLKDNDKFARYVAEKHVFNFEGYSDRLRADPKFQAYMELGKASFEQRSPDLYRFPEYIRKAYDMVDMMTVIKNGTEFRELFANYAEIFEVAAMQQQQPPLPRQVTPSGVLDDVDPF